MAGVVSRARRPPHLVLNLGVVHLLGGQPHVLAQMRPDKGVIIGKHRNEMRPHNNRFASRPSVGVNVTVGVKVRRLYTDDLPVRRA